ncbi:hypothetical protein A2W24_05515 [Microgenomates group bacterium RBG_16_45_19]|nr:MAG: hypothetical protein A2W24_05515 [Microgenomates group bacterium RBG_16_45_19]
MEVYNVYQAKTNLSHLLSLVQKGQSITIAKANKPIADLVPHQKKTLKTRKLDFLKGKIKIAPDFDAYDKVIEKLFYESKIFPG